MGIFFYSGNDNGDYDFDKLRSMRKEKSGIGDEMATQKNMTTSIRCKLSKPQKNGGLSSAQKKGCLLCRP